MNTDWKLSQRYKDLKEKSRSDKVKDTKWGKKLWRLINERMQGIAAHSIIIIIILELLAIKRRCLYLGFLVIIMGFSFIKSK